MSINSITSGFSSFASPATLSKAPQTDGTSFDSLVSAGASSDSTTQKTGVYTAPKTDPAVTNFMNYMKESPAQRYIDSWLAAHHLTEEDLKKMSPEKREAVMKAIAQDMKTAIQQGIEKKTGSMLSLNTQS